VEKVLKIAIDHGISEEEATDEISKLIKNEFLLEKILKIIEMSFYPSFVFSKSELWSKQVTKNKLIYSLKYSQNI
jgi:hypothetical protein